MKLWRVMQRGMVIVMDIYKEVNLGLEKGIQEGRVNMGKME